MIRINTVKISNFRSYKNSQNQAIELKSLNMFTGKNNTGKTNILRAINLFFNPELYDPKIDMNMVKQLTKGGTKDPRIEIEVTDDELIKGKVSTYEFKLDLNQDVKNRYSAKTRRRDEELLNKLSTKFSNSNEVKKYLEQKFRCIYLSTTDEDISDQAYKVVNDMILQFYKRKNQFVRSTINDFEKKYTELLTTFEANITSLERELSEQFELFKENGIEIAPKLKIEENTSISNFLLDNIKLELDDSYSQIVKAKGAGIQRTSLILLSFFLMNEIYSTKNKIILLDEPEAFLYPLLISGLKKTIENSVDSSNTSQIFLTSHAREFLTEINNPLYSFYNIDQKLEEKKYQRSKNEIDINKYSTVNKFDQKTKFEVLKNYGLLDDIDDYEDVIICEGKTDRNYIVKVLEGKEFRPQIRFEKYSNNFEEEDYKESKDLDHNFYASGTQAIIPILIYLDKISPINRRVFILLDGDQAGEKVDRLLKKDKYEHLEITKKKINHGLEIEDMMFTKTDFINLVLEISPEIKSKEDDFKEIISGCKTGESIIDKTEQFIKMFNLKQNILDLKNKLSVYEKNDKLQREWLLTDLEKVFYS